MYSNNANPPQNPAYAALPNDIHDAFDNLYHKVVRTIHENESRAAGSDQLSFLQMQIGKLEQLVNSTLSSGMTNEDQRRDPGRHTNMASHPNVPGGPSQGHGPSGPPLQPPGPPPGFDQGRPPMFSLPGAGQGPAMNKQHPGPEGQPGVVPPHMAQRPPPGPDNRPFPPNMPGMPPNGPQTMPSPAPHEPRPGPLVDPRGPPPPHSQGPQSRYPGSPHVSQVLPPPPPPPQMGVNGDRYEPIQQINLADVEFDTLDPEYKADGADWYAVFNPNLPRSHEVELVHTLDHSTVVCCVRFSMDGKFVATGCNWSAYIYDVHTGQEVSELKDANVSNDNDLYIRSVCFSPDGVHLATGAEDKIIRVWNIEKQVVSREFHGHEQDIYSLDYSHDGKLIASGSGDRTVRLWDVNKGDVLMVLTIDDGVTTVAISPDNMWVAAGSLDKTVRVWDLETGKHEQRLDGEGGHRDSVYSVAFSPDGNHLVSGSLDKTIKIWDLPREAAAHKKAVCNRTFTGHKDFVLSVALTPGGQFIMSGSKDRGVQFWDPRNGNAILMLQGHKNSVISVAPSPSSDMFATGSGDMRARIWRLRSLQ